MVVIDAFSSDFVPIHLIGVEAMRTWFDKVEPGGLVMFHISNRSFDFIPVLARIGTELGLPTAAKDSTRSTDDELSRGIFHSTWFALARDDAALEPLRRDLGWKTPKLSDAQAKRPVWTDDYVNLFHALR